MKVFLHLFFILAVLLVNACAKYKTAVERVPPPEKKGVYHVVERHQTLYRICKTYGVNINEVARVNGIADRSKIKEGQRIFIPGAKKVLRVEVYIDDVVAEPAEKEKEKVAYKKLNFIWPVEGRVADSFYEIESKRHLGIDISSPLGTPIKASSSGTVIYSSNTIRGYGNLIIIRHSEEYVTVYAHNQVNLVEEGSRVERGQIIGKVGETGRATGPHLHFEIRKNNKAVDPMLYLK